jgi:hypothetical protein
MNDLIVSTNTGYLLSYSRDVWTPLHYDPDLANYSMLSGSKDGNIVVAGSINGELTVLSSTGQFMV